jgi:hypothetical protein
MPFVYFGTGWFIGIALASALQLPLEFLLLAFLVPISGLVLWWKDRRARLIWFSVFAALLGGLRFALSVPHLDQNSLSTYNGSGSVTIEGVITGPPDVRDTYLNLRVAADQLTTLDRSTRPIEGVVLVRPSRPADFLARQGVYSLIDRPRLSVLEHERGNPLLVIVYDFRDRAYEVIQQILPEPQASLLSSGLARSVGSQEAEDRMLLHRQVEVLQRLHLLSRLAQVVSFNDKRIGRVIFSSSYLHAHLPAPPVCGEQQQPGGCH